MAWAEIVDWLWLDFTRRGHYFHLMLSKDPWFCAVVIPNMPNSTIMW
jgi:hypothetical protein